MRPLTASANAPADRSAQKCVDFGQDIRTRHTLIPVAEGTTISVDIEITGPLTPVWGRLVGRKHAAGLPAQTARFIAGARARLAAA